MFFINLALKLNFTYYIQSTFELYVHQVVSQEFCCTDTILVVDNRELATDNIIWKVSNEFLLQIGQTPFLTRTFSQILILMDHTMLTNDSILTKEVGGWRQIPGWNARAKLLMVLTLNETKNATKAFATSIFNSIRNISGSASVLMMLTPVHADFWTWSGNSSQCTDIPVLSKKWIFKEGNYVASAIFKEYKSINLKGCLFKIGLTSKNKGTFIRLSENENLKADNQSKGLEISILDVLAKYLNFTYQIVYIPPINYSVCDRKKNCQNNFFGMMQRHEVDWMMGGLHLTLERTLLADFLYSYINDELVWLVPKPRPISPWQGVFSVFQAITWAAIAITYISSSIVTYFLRSKKSSFLMIWALTLATSFKLDNKHGLLRPFLGLYILCLIIINLSFQIGFIKYMSRNHFERSINIPMDAAKRQELTLIAPASFAVEKKDGEFWKYVHKTGRYCRPEDSTQYYHRLVKEKSVYMLAPKMTVDFEMTKLGFINKNEMPFGILKEKYRSTQVTMYMPKHNTQKYVIDQIMKAFIESGLISFWQSQELLHLYHLPSTNKNHSLSSDFAVITLAEMGGVFAVLLFGILLSTVTFFYEVVKVRSKHRSDYVIKFVK